MQAIGTGALLDLSHERSREGDVLIALELFADADIDGRREGLRGPTSFTPIELDRDLTNQLVTAAHNERDTNTGTIFGDLVRTGRAGSMTRFELYSAPLRIELSHEPRQRLVGAWRKSPAEAYFRWDLSWTRLLQVDQAPAAAIVARPGEGGRVNEPYVRFHGQPPHSSH